MNLKVKTIMYDNENMYGSIGTSASFFFLIDLKLNTNKFLRRQFFLRRTLIFIPIV